MVMVLVQVLLTLGSESCSYLGGIEYGPFLGLTSALGLSILIKVLLIDLGCKRALAAITLNELDLNHRLLIAHTNCIVVHPDSTRTRDLRLVQAAWRWIGRRLVFDEQVRQHLFVFGLLLIRVFGQ